MDTMLDYTSTQLNSFRSFSHDAINIFGFSLKQTENGAVKAKMSIKDGLRLATYYMPHVIYAAYYMR